MTKRFVKKALALVLTMMIAALMLITGAPIASAETSTNVGLAAHCLRAYREGWQYVWGGTSYGYVDCSGMIYTYNGVGGSRVDMLGSSYEWGYVSSGVPNIHGLGLHSPGHVGVYIGSGIAIDARDEYSGVVRHNVYTRNWVEWFKVAGVSYPQNGWVLLDGESFYYENGQYIVSTSRTLDGVTYYFDAAGVSNINPPSTSYEATDYSYISDHGSSDNYYYGYDDDDDDNYSYNNDDNDDGEDDYYDYYAEQSRLEEERRQQEEAEALRKQQEEEARKKAEEEAKKKAEEEARKKAEEEAKKKAEEEARKKAEEEAKKKAEEARKKAEAEAKKKAEEEARIKAEEERKKAEENAVIAEYDYEDTDDSKTVTAIQTRLYELGYLPKKATGYYGEETVNAVMVFQNMNDLEVTGIVTAKTFKVLKSDKAKNDFNLLEQGSFDDGSELSVTSLQERLAELKYYYDEITGFYGELTASAVKQFQKNNELQATGAADPETQLRLFSDKAKENPNAGCAVYGESGALIEKLQKRLIELRYLSGIVTGKFDDATLEAVKIYQKTAGLAEDDKLTAEQLEVLYSDKAVKPTDFAVMKYGFSGEDVAQLQSRLASLKYYDGKTSGVYSKAVVASVESFQKDFGLDVTGIADVKTVEAIKTETQRESNHVGEQLILKTATVSDNALAGVADVKSGEIKMSKTTDNDFAKTLIVLGAVLAVVLLFTAVFVVEMKKKSAKQKADKK